MWKPVNAQARSRRALALVVIGLASVSQGGCALFGAHGESTVAQGKYYSSGNAYYDQFFVDLYLLQVGMAEAPKVPEAERQRMIQLLKLPAQATPAIIEQRLHEEAANLSRAGVHLRLDQSSPSDDPDAARTTIRSNARPKEDPAATLLATVETSSTNLVRWLLTMKQKEQALARLELMTIRLDAGVDSAFSQASVGKPSEVKRNLADAHKLMPLMRQRAGIVRASTEQLLAALTHGIDTDDGSIGPAIGDQPAQAESARGRGAPPEPDKKAAGKPHAKGKPPSVSAAPAARPKPQPANGDGEAPAKPRAPSKPVPAPRDFEP